MLTAQASQGEGRAMRYLDDDKILNKRIYRRICYMMDEIWSYTREIYTPVISYNEAHSLFCRKEDIPVLQAAGRIMRRYNADYSVSVEPGVTIVIECHGGEEMPNIMFPKSFAIDTNLKRINNMLAPLRKAQMQWMHWKYSFEAISAVLDRTRDFNVFFPWINLLIPPELIANSRRPDMGTFQVSNWFGGSDNTAEARQLVQQFNILTSAVPSHDHVWIPRDLVMWAKEGATIITQYNIMKSNAYLRAKLDSYCRLDLSLSFIEQEVSKLQVVALEKKNEQKAAKNQTVKTD